MVKEEVTFAMGSFLLALSCIMLKNGETYFKNLRCERVLYINRNIEEKHNTENSLDQGVVFLKR